MRVIVAVALAFSMCACNGATSFPTSPTVTAQPLYPTAGPTVLKGVTLSGVVYELTPTARVPIAGAIVYCEPCGEETHTFAYADDKGFYHFTGDLARGGGIWVAPGVPTAISVSHNKDFEDPPGLPPSRHGPGWREVLIDGDTTFDIELVRR